jgi:hypothetical protein
VSGQTAISALNHKNQHNRSIKMVAKTKA